jgi:hypothetical protein
MTKIILILSILFTVNINSCDNYITLNSNNEIIFAISGSPFDCPTFTEREIKELIKEYCSFKSYLNENSIKACEKWKNNNNK